MKSIKPGRGPSMMGGVMCIVVAGFGLIWTIGASGLTKNSMSFGTGLGSMGGGLDIGSIFPLFGVLFMIIAIAGAIYNFKNATGKNRYSAFDITDSDEEPDPLNERFGEQTAYRETTSSLDNPAFCPYCGHKADDDHLFCSKCGKKMAKD